MNLNERLAEFYIESSSTHLRRVKLLGKFTDNEINDALQQSLLIIEDGLLKFNDKPSSKVMEVPLLQDPTLEFVIMCEKSDFLQSNFNNRHQNNKIHQKEFVLRNKDGKLVWIPTQKQLQHLLSVNDELDNSEFVEDMELFFKDLLEQMRKFPWINTLEKAMLHLLIQKLEGKYWNIITKTWDTNA